MVNSPIDCFGLAKMSHYNDVIMGAMASQITSLTIVYSTVYSGVDQGKHQSSASLAFVRGIHRGPVNSPHKWPVTRKMFPFDDVIMHDKWMLLLQHHILWICTITVTVIYSLFLISCHLHKSTILWAGVDLVKYHNQFCLGVFICCVIYVTMCSTGVNFRCET